MASEKRLIDANELLGDAADYSPISCGLADMYDVKWLVDAQPTVDAVEVVHGRWEKSEYNGFVRCDKCKDVYIDESWLTDGKWNYCPNCGAKMDGERKDNE